MDIKTFKVERWMNDYEDEAVYNLGETCIDSITVGELLDMAGEDADKYLISLKDKRLTCGYIFGSPDLLSGIASSFGNAYLSAALFHPGIHRSRSPHTSAHSGEQFPA